MLHVFSGPGEGGCVSSDCERVLTDLSLDTGTQFLCLKIFLGADVSPCGPSPGTALWLSGVYAGEKKQKQERETAMARRLVRLLKGRGVKMCSV